MMDDVDSDFAFCGRCGARISSSAKFCGSCGVSQAQFEVPVDAPSPPLVAPAEADGDIETLADAGANAETQVIPELETPRCNSCDRSLEVGFHFCPFCGASQR